MQSSNGNVYVTSVDDAGDPQAGYVSVLDNVTNKVIHTVSVGDSPSFTQYNPSNGNIYVGNEGSNSVSVINFPAA
jgi:YVTN family beta-propeller protein